MPQPVHTSSRVHPALGLIGWLALCACASLLGAAASVQASAFYGDLTQPGWAPPGWVFGPVWSTLYCMMAIAAWLVWRQGGWSAQGLELRFFIAQLVANAAWSWLFFAWKQGLWAFIDLIALWVLLVATIALFWRVHRLAALLLLPYLAWVSFAGALNLSVWRLNPAALG